MSRDDLIALRARIDELEGILKLQGKLWIHEKVIDKPDDELSIDPEFVKARLDKMKKVYKEKNYERNL